jgi:hypothetical protein
MTIAARAMRHLYIADAILDARGVQRTRGFLLRLVPRDSRPRTGSVQVGPDRVDPVRAGLSPAGSVEPAQIGDLVRTGPNIIIIIIIHVGVFTIY